MQNEINVILDRRPEHLSVVYESAENAGMADGIRAGSMVTARQFGAPIYLEVVGISADGEIHAVIVELDDKIFDPEVIIAFEMNVPVRISDEFIYSVDRLKF